ncbi:hypothetical protein [Streptomyces sp. 1222.5]|uniref:hypothetical protein n=1 Tax=Streptomyces sp. 1222.5 TaxID=1881026 RepID=UPI003EBFC4FB
MNGPAYAPLQSLPPARKQLVAALLGYGMERSDIEELLENVEAEQAEWIRDQVDELDTLGVGPMSFSREFRAGMYFAANCLDPHDGRGVPPERGGRD